MSPAAREKKLASLRTGLAYASKAHRPAIQAMIDELLAEQNAASRGSAPEGAVLAESRSDAAISALTPHACREGEDNGTLQSDTIPALGMGPTGQDGECTGPRGRTTPSAGGEPPPFVTRAAGPDKPRIERMRAKPATPETAPRTQRCAIKGAQTIAARSARVPGSSMRPQSARKIAEHRQQPRRPTWRLEWHPEIVIGPARPAPPRYYRPGAVMFDGRIAGRRNAVPFRDDLNAIADHGSGGPSPLPDRGQSRASPLGW